MKSVVEKKLSPNDIGLTGGHQAGILVPKKEDLLKFFPALDRKAENPRVTIRFVDALGQEWKFNYIYYNNRIRGGTRNEFRLTGMTKFFRQEGAVDGDTLIFTKEDGEYSIEIKRGSDVWYEEDGIVTLVLDEAWRIINY